MAKIRLFTTIVLVFLFKNATCVINFDKKVGIFKILVENNELNENCENDLKRILINIDEKSSIGHKMLKTWSKFRSDYEYGNSYDFGDFDDCMEISDDQNDIYAKYCSIQYYYNDNSVKQAKPHISMMNFNWKNLSTRFGGAICLPDKCSAKDIEIIMTKFFEGSKLIKANDYNQNEYCKSARLRKEIDYKMIGFISIIISLIMTVTISTILSKKSTNQFFQCFSLTNNIKNFLQIPKGRESSSIDGLKGVSHCVIILLHYIGCAFGFAFKNGYQAAAVVDSKILQVVSFVGMTTENFFILSGFLVVRSMAKTKSQKPKTNKFLQLLQVYLRFFFPLLFLLLAHMMTSSYFFNNSPFYNLSTKECEKYWWSTLLHLHTYLNPGELCLPYSWFLTTTFHIILFLPIIFFIIKRVPSDLIPLVYFFIMIILTMIARCIALEKIEGSFEIPDLLNIKNDIFKYVYVPTHTRAASFFAGMLLGELLNKNILQPMVSKKFLQRILFVLFFSMIFYNTSVALSSQIYTLTKYNLTISSIWYIICFSIVILLCELYEGSLKRFLSKKFWIYLSKLSLCIYLMGVHLQFLLVSIKKEPLEVGNLVIFAKGMSIDLLLMVMPILFLYFFVEIPFVQLVKILIQKLQKNIEEEKNKKKK
ncbi:hypothetical protein PVAND_016092 [Polypedilum vanderplanki]|uniref:Nose resistant-to-fluoxetine protein N-terminal domain-containing protein n=1 Tax=Polypedilum vanderplanki TaxID=319348 RepID=A0A9J6BE42_POLVA|nr:hypothetical protein PVAND_016092 [Polypedilum vanderplanki]